MLTSIFETLVSAIAEILDKCMTMFLDALNMNLSTYLDTFPLFGNIYTFLQKFSIALLVIISGFALAKFWTTAFTGENMPDRPAGVLLRSLAGGAGIYMGGYLLEFIVRMGTIPYEEALQLNGGKMYFNVSEFLESGAAQFATAGTDPTGTLVAAGLGMVLFEFLMLILIAVNLFKLVIEVCERYLMVGVLVFTSPLIYATVGPSDKLNIFKRWFSMFVGSVIQMTISVLFLKLVVSGLQANSEANFIIQLILVLAMCKIAQRVDTYLQQIGVGVATTGGNMVDDFMGLFHSMQRLASGSRGRATGSSGTPVGGSGRTMFGQMWSAARGAYASGQDRSGIWKAAKGAAANYMKNNPSIASRVAQKGRVGDDMVNSAMKAKAEGQNAFGVATAAARGAANSARGIGAQIVNKDGLKQAAGDIRKAQAVGGPAAMASGIKKAAGHATSGIRGMASVGAATVASQAVRFMDPSGAAMRDAALAKVANGDSKEAAVQEFATGSRPLPNQLKDDAANEKFNPRDFEKNRQEYGIAENGLPFKNEGGSPELTDAGKLAGLEQKEDGTVTGNPDSVGDFLAQATNRDYANNPAPHSLANDTGHDDQYYSRIGVKAAEDAYQKDKELLSDSGKTELKNLQDKASAAERRADMLQAQGAPADKAQQAREDAIAMRGEANTLAAQHREAQARMDNKDTAYAQVAANAEAQARYADDEHYAQIGRDAAEAQRNEDMHLASAENEQSVQSLERAATAAEGRVESLRASGANETEIARAQESASAKRAEATQARAEINDAKARLSSPDYYTANAQEAADSYRASDRETVSSANRSRVANMEAHAAVARQTADNLAASGAPAAQVREASRRADNLQAQAKAARAEISAAESRQNPHSYYNSHQAEAAAFYENRDRRITSADNVQRVADLEQKAAAATAHADSLQASGASSAEVSSARAEAAKLNSEAAVRRQEVRDAESRLSTPGYYQNHQAEAASALRANDQRLVSPANETRVSAMEARATAAETRAANLETSGASVPEIDKARTEAAELRQAANESRMAINDARSRVSAVEGNPYGGSDGQSRYVDDQRITGSGNRSRVSDLERRADAAEKHAADLEQKQAGSQEAIAARNEANTLRQQADEGQNEIRSAEGRLGYNDYYSAHPSEAGAYYKSADTNLTGAANRQRVEGLRTAMESADAHVASVEASGASDAEIAAARREASDAREVYERESGAIRGAELRLGYQKAYNDYGDTVANLERSDDQLAYVQTREQYQSRANDIISRTIDNATPYEIDRAISNINHEYGDTVHTRRMAERVFGEALPDREGNAPVSSFRAYNLPDTHDSNGATVYGGRVYEVGYRSSNGDRNIQFYDQQFYDALPAADKNQFRQFIYADGRAFYFRGTKDVTSQRTGKQIVRRIARKLQK